MLEAKYVDPLIDSELGGVIYVEEVLLQPQLPLHDCLVCAFVDQLDLEKSFHLERLVTLHRVGEDGD